MAVGGGSGNSVGNKGGGQHRPGKAKRGAAAASQVQADPVNVLQTKLAKAREGNESKAIKSKVKQKPR